MSTTRFSADYAKRVAGCKKCKLQVAKGELRLAKIVPNPFTADSDHPSDMKQYFHANCLFESFTKCRATTKVIESVEDIEGWDLIKEEDREKVIELIGELETFREKKSNTKVKGSKNDEQGTTKAAKSKEPVASDSKDEKSRTKKSEVLKEKEVKKESKNVEKKSKTERSKKARNSAKESSEEEDDVPKQTPSKYDSFKYFCKLCEVIASVSKYTDKSTAVKIYVSKDDYDGDLLLLAKFLIPSVDQRVYNLKEKQLIKIFSNILETANEEVTDAFNESGDVSITIEKYFEKTKRPKKTTLTLQQVDKWLDELAELTKEDECSPIDLRYIIRLIMKDLRFNAGAKHILEGIRPGAYEVFQNTRDLKKVIEKSQKLEDNVSMIVDSDICLGVPIKPMLAEACRSVEQAMKKWKSAMFSEIKYDGERVQIHKNGDRFNFFSRSLKPVQEHKISHFSSVIPQAFPSVRAIVLDAEVLLVDTETGKPLPFGTLGVHKKEKFKNASVCLFIFDCLHFDGRSMMNRPLRERKEVLLQNIKEIPNQILLSNYETIKTNESAKLRTMILKAIDEGLEGLVLKDVDSVYEPGKRHWLKVKKDYLEEGKMADTADLIVLGAYYGTGSKGFSGGMMSVFLMGVRNPETKKFLTVTKCGNGHTDETLDRINLALKDKMQKISRNYDSLPKWIKCSRSLVPDFIMKDPTDSVVWEITGAQFSQSDKHTADGISIRFPRVTKIRDDKTWETATNLNELKVLFTKSQQKSDLDSSVNDDVPLFDKKCLNDPGTCVNDEKKMGDMDEKSEEGGKSSEIEKEKSEERKHKGSKRKKAAEDNQEGASSKRRKHK